MLKDAAAQSDMLRGKIVMVGLSLSLELELELELLLLLLLPTTKASGAIVGAAWAAIAPPSAFASPSVVGEIVKAEATVWNGPSSRDRIRSSCNKVAIAGLGGGESGVG